MPRCMIFKNKNRGDKKIQITINYEHIIQMEDTADFEEQDFTVFVGPSEVYSDDKKKYWNLAIAVYDQKDGYRRQTFENIWCDSEDTAVDLKQIIKADLELCRENKIHKACTTISRPEKQEKNCGKRKVNIL